MKRWICQECEEPTGKLYSAEVDGKMKAICEKCWDEQCSKMVLEEVDDDTQ